MAHDEVVKRYSGPARAAMLGRVVLDCEASEFERGCFGAAGSDDTVGLPDGAVRAGLGCGNPVAVAELRAAVLAEAFRVLRPGGRFGVSDVVTDGELSEERRQAAEQRIGCAAGALSVADYRGLLLGAGFVGARITLTADHGDGVHSAIVQAVKPAIGPGKEIRPMREADAEQVLAIYQAGLDTGQASFEITAPSWEGFTAAKRADLRYVAVDTDSGEVVGWVAASQVSSRPVYAGVIEHSVYVHPGCQEQGIGRALLSALIAASEDAGVWTIQSGIFPENAGSLTLHQALGFRVVGTRERVGCHHGVWRDVLMVERRSAVAGR